MRAYIAQHVCCTFVTVAVMLMSPDVSGSSWRARFGNGSLTIGDCDASITKQAGQWLACTLEVTYKKPTIEIQLWGNLVETLQRHQKT